MYLELLPEHLYFPMTSNLSVIRSCACRISKLPHQQFLGDGFQVLIESNLFVKFFLAKQEDYVAIYRATNDINTKQSEASLLLHDGKELVDLLPPLATVTDEQKNF